MRSCVACFNEQQVRGDHRAGDKQPPRGREEMLEPKCMVG